MILLPLHNGESPQSVKCYEVPSVDDQLYMVNLFWIVCDYPPNPSEPS